MVCEDFRGVIAVQGFAASEHQVVVISSPEFSCQASPVMFRTTASQLREGEALRCSSEGCGAWREVANESSLDNLVASVSCDAPG